MMNSYFLKAIKLIRNGACPFCYKPKYTHKSGINTYFCSGCDCTIIIGKDWIIVEWYVIKHGSRILRSKKIDSNSERWKEMTNFLKDKRNT